MSTTLANYGTHRFVVVTPEGDSAKRLKEAILRSGNLERGMLLDVVESIEDAKALASVERKIRCLFLDATSFDLDETLTFLDWFREVRPYSPIVLYVDREAWQNTPIQQAKSTRLSRYWKLYRDSSAATMDGVRPVSLDSP